MMRALLGLGFLLTACSEPNENVVDQGVSCADACPIGGRRCADEQVQFCADYDGDGCPEWGGAAACPTGQSCADGLCVSACESDCSAGATTCAPEGGVRTCGLDGAGCPRLGDPVACADDERCDDGACVPADQMCVDSCETADATRCADDGIERCGDFDPDACLEWSTARPCPANSVCRDGACAPRCADECAAGEARCDGDGVRSCGNFDADLCLELGPAVACAAEERCDEGACRPRAEACEDACAIEGDPICRGETAYQRCGQFDADPCLDLGPAVDCAPNEACSAGVCAVVCTDDCDAGDGRCADGAAQTCGDFDADPCLEWSPPTPCVGALLCANGECLAPACEHECQQPGASRCDTPESSSICGDFDDDACLEWGDPTPCPNGSECLGFECARGFPPNVVINEILYDAEGADGPRVFVELAGPPGAPLAGLRLAGINGADGQRYQTTDLDGVFGDDGLFVIATEDADAALAAQADQRGAVDFQNGPDAVILLFDQQQIDGIAYGEGAPQIGEGAAAPDAPGGRSLSRDAAHTDTQDNAVDFRVGDPSPGVP